MVLDDDAECLDLARVALSTAGFKVDAFEGLKQFFDHLESGLPDALVLDRHFPGGSGEMLAARLRGLLGRERPPVVLWTADSRRDLEATLLTGLVNDMVIKGQQGTDTLVQRVVNLVGWEHMGKGMMLNAKGGFVLFRGERSRPLTGREIDFLLKLGMSGSGGVCRGAGRLMLLEPGDDRRNLALNRVVNRLMRKLPPALRAALVTVRGEGWRLDS